MEEISNNFQGELDHLKMELVTMLEVRKSDTVKINRVQASLKSMAKDIELNADAQGRIEQKVEKIDNATNKNLERIAN